MRWRGAALGAVLGTALTAAAVTGPGAARATGPGLPPGCDLATARLVGCWHVLASTAASTHMALLHTGKVLLMEGSGRDLTRHDPARTYPLTELDPATDTVATFGTPYDFFCGGHAFLPDGRLLVTGGVGLYGQVLETDAKGNPVKDADGHYVPEVGDPDQNHYATVSGYTGSAQSWIFDPTDGTWTRTGDEQQPHWYPTLTERGDGSITSLGGYGTRVQSGPDSGDSVFTRDLEAFDATTGTWSTLATAPFDWSFYPHVLQLADGRLFYSGGRTYNQAGALREGVLDPTTATISTQVGNDSDAYPHQGYGAVPLDDLRAQASTVMEALTPSSGYRQRVLVIGGGNTQPQADGSDWSTNDVEEVDLGTATAPATAFSYVKKAPMHDARMDATAVELPDHRIFTSGGTPWSNLATAIKQPQGWLTSEVFDPTNDTWTSWADPSVRRSYHSSALLLPDGRILTAGSSLNDPFTEEQRLEVFSPPYLFQGASSRPVIATPPPTELGYAQAGSLTLDGTAATDLATLSLVKPMSPTHAEDVNQRVVDLAFTQDGDDVSFTTPPTGDVLPPGWWMLMATTKEGVPSVASWVHVTDPPSASPAAPSAPSPAPPATTTPAPTAAPPGQAGVISQLLGGQPVTVLGVSRHRSGPPRKAHATAAGTTVTVTWQVPASSGGDRIDRWIVHVGPRTTSVKATRRSATVRGLTAGRRYVVTVAAVTAAGSGAPATTSIRLRPGRAV